MRKVQSVADKIELKATRSNALRRVVFVRNREPGMARIYVYKHADTTPADDVSIIEPNDRLGRYFQFILSLLILCVVSHAATPPFDGTPWRMDVYTNVADMLANHSPRSVNKAVYVLGYYKPGDGGDGVFFATNSAAMSTNRGVYLRATLDPTRTFVRSVSGRVIHAAAFGARLDRISNDTAPIQDALDYVNSIGGGGVYVPNAAFNASLATHNNVWLEGAGALKDYRTGPPTLYWAPYDQTQPIIKVGSDSTDVKGFSLRNATLVGNGSSSCGIAFAGGAQEAYLDNISVWRFRTNFFFCAGLSYPSTLIFINGFYTQPSTDANSYAIYALMRASQSSYTTAIYFSNGHVNGPTGSGSYAYYIDGTTISMANVYSDLADQKGMFFKKTNSGVQDPWIDCVNCTFDSSSSTPILVTTSDQDIPYASWWTPGNARFKAGSRVKNTVSGNIYNIVTGSTQASYQSQYPWPQIWGHMSFNDGSHTDWSENQTIYSDGSLIAENKTGNINIRADQHISITPTNGGLNLYGGGVGINLKSGNVFIDNGRAVYFKNSGGSDVATLSSSGDNMAFGSGGTITINPTGVINLNSATGVNVAGGSNHALTVTSGILQLDNNQGVWMKNGSGTPENMMNLTGANSFDLFAPSAGGNMQIGTRNASGYLGLFSGAQVEKWRVTSAGVFLPISTYDIAASGQRAGTGYFTALNVPTIGDISTALNAKQVGPLSGDVTTSSAGSATTTLANSGVTAGTYGSASYIPSFTVDAKGRVTAVTTNAVSGGGGGYTTVYNQGGAITARSIINFIGGGVTALDNAGATRSDVTVTRTGVVREQYFPVAVMNPLAPLSTGSIGTAFATLDYDDTTTEYAAFTFCFPSSWDVGSIKYKVFWTATTGTPGQSVAWSLKSQSLSDNESMSGTISGGDVTDAYQTSGAMHITSATSHTIFGSPALGEPVQFLIARHANDAADTKTGDAQLVGVMIQWTESTTEPTAW